MQIQQTEEGDLLLTQIDPLIGAIFRQIPSSADPENHEGALDRLYGDPVETQDPQSDEINQEWAEYVRPELRHLFATALETIGIDLAEMVEKRVEMGNDHFTFLSLRIPAAHIPAWIHALNQARIVLAERHGFGQEELDDAARTPFRSSREFALWRMEVYGEILGYLIHLQDERENGEDDLDED